MAAAGSSGTAAKVRPPAGWRQVRQRLKRERDLRPRPFPAASADDWRQPAETLAALYQWAETRALEATDWYLRDKRWRKLSSRMLRVLAIVLVAAGGLQPLLSTVRPGRNAEWGFVLLATAAACVGFDHFFGLSSGWMRDMVTAQALQRRLDAFQFDWATESARSALATVPDGGEVNRRLVLLRRFVEDIGDLISAETGDWMTEFQGNVTQLQTQAGPPWTGGQARPVRPRESGDSMVTRSRDAR